MLAKQMLAEELPWSFLVANQSGENCSHVGFNLRNRSPSHPARKPPRLRFWEVGANQGDCSAVAEASDVLCSGYEVAEERASEQRGWQTLAKPHSSGNFAVHMLSSWGRRSSQSPLGHCIGIRSCALGHGEVLGLGLVV